MIDTRRNWNPYIHGLVVITILYQTGGRFGSTIVGCDAFTSCHSASLCGHSYLPYDEFTRKKSAGASVEHNSSFRTRTLSFSSGAVRRRGRSSTASVIPGSSASVSSTDDGDDGYEEEQARLLKKKKFDLTKEFIWIGGPAFCQLAAEPLAALVDTAYLGRLGPEVLGGAGVAISAQYAVSKLYNDPLLCTSISLVASQEGKTRASGNKNEVNAEKELSVAVSSALLLAATVGLIQLVVFAAFCKAITISMGVSPTSSMWFSAVSYLQVRAFGTPAATLWLVANGVFRGLGDTSTPLVYSLIFTALNAILDPLFIFVFHWGASGAAAGTALAQYIALVPLLMALNRRVKIDILGQLEALGDSLKQYVRAGGLVLFRTLGKVTAYAVCSRQAALLGPIDAAAYNLTFQLGFATTQICEAVAVAVQTLLARELAEATSTDTENSGEAKAALMTMSQKITYSPSFRAKIIRHLINAAVAAGGLVATTLSAVTWWRRDWILAGMTTNPAVQASAAAIFPAVLLTQVMKGMAYPVNGIIMGGLDWFFSMVTMWLANIVCVAMVRGFAAGGHVVTLGQIWWSLAAFMGTQVVVGIIRYQSRTGVWKALKGKNSEPETE